MTADVARGASPHARDVPARETPASTLRTMHVRAIDQDRRDERATGMPPQPGDRRQASGDRPVATLSPVDPLRAANAARVPEGHVAGRLSPDDGEGEPTPDTPP